MPKMFLLNAQMQLCSPLSHTASACYLCPQLRLEILSSELSELISAANTTAGLTGSLALILFSPLPQESNSVHFNLIGLLR